jgi:hypothetical protein
VAMHDDDVSSFTEMSMEGEEEALNFHPADSQEINNEEDDNVDEGTSNTLLHERNLKEDPLPPSNNIMGWCSWCFQYTLANLNEKTPIFRDKLECTKCERSVSKCILCADGLAKSEKHSNPLPQGVLCARCDGTIPGSTQHPKTHILLSLILFI